MILLKYDPMFVVEDPDEEVEEGWGSDYDDEKDGDANAIDADDSTYKVRRAAIKVF